MHSKNVCNVHENGKNEHEEVDMYKYPPFLYMRLLPGGCFQNRTLVLAYRKNNPPPHPTRSFGVCYLQKLRTSCVVLRLHKKYIGGGGLYK